MQRPFPGAARWLLLSDLHFKRYDLDRVWQTAQWIVSEAKRNQVKRVVICGDLLTSRTMQPTHVLSACYRFISLLSDVVPRVHIVLGNHDLAYRRDYQTTALDALNISRLAPYVSLHSSIARHEWDGRSVLLLPFREEQDELTEAVAALYPSEASKTVAFAHLAINKAITQRYVVNTGINKPHAANSITYRGLTGPDRFASLARTFTGHFHSHQTIVQKQTRHNSTVDMRGSITYLGSPLQLNWADLNDEQRGVVLFNPETLEHELLTNPHAVDYITADVHQVLDGQIDKGAVEGKHVMLLGELTHLKYVTAREKLLSLGVRSVRDWTPVAFAFRPGFGASVPASDAAVQLLEEPAKDETGPDMTSDAALDSNLDSEPRAGKLDLAGEVRKYVEALDLNESLLLRRDKLTRVGQRIIHVSREVEDQDSEAEVSHRDFLDGLTQPTDTRTTSEPSTDVFVAEPRRLTITNFLGVQTTTTIDFRQDLPRGLTFLVGKNGSGKSTVIEAMVWCQFGQCIRSGLTVNDVVNDQVGKDCSVVLEFANGYTIARYRKHKIFGNRIIVSLHGEPQPQFEHPTARTTQEAINDLLGTDYKTYVRTVVLSQESATSFLNSTLTQRRDFIEASLGLSILDQCGQVSKLLLRDIDNDVDKSKVELDGLTQTKGYVEHRIKELDQTRKQLEKEAAKVVASLNTAIQKHTDSTSRIDELRPFDEEYAQFEHEKCVAETDIADRGQQISAASKRAQEFPKLSQSAKLNKNFDAEISLLQDQIYSEQENLNRMEKLYARIQAQKLVKPASWLSQLQRQTSERLKAMTAAHPIGIYKILHAVKISMLYFRLIAIGSLLHITGTTSRGSQVTSAKDYNQKAAINSLREDVKDSASRLQSLRHKTDRVIALETSALNYALRIKEQLAQIIQSQKVCEDLRQQVTLKQSEIDTYSGLLKKEQSHLHLLCSEYGALDTKLKDLEADREIFAFWSSALAKRPRRASSSSSTRSTAKAATNFRELALAKSLSELNARLVQVLTVLYDDTQRGRVMAAGMLRSLFDADSVDNMMDTFISSPRGVHTSLAYGKQSGGERKRVDLALYFALLQLTWSKSAHRAHYVFIDEVFDNLDEAGQAAVAKWCGLISQTVADWVLMITHSRFLSEQDPGEYAGKVSVVRAEKGQRGAELYTDGRRIGVQDGDS
ncbi:nuclease SbcCD subunit C [Trichoderma asperellum]|uniref:Nuclease SbcCD subunit C n=1 Tax=Trichoderma asperellum TaxID=101201 RepID=A0A6V8QWJ5_TRIAP|nr:nuclease SbcCD subunit C [Trichoderma asperellum]